MTYNENDQLLSDGISNYGYDAKGNQVLRTNSEGTTTYTYDSEGQLVEVITPTDSIQYSYDASGTRLSRTVNGNRANFLVDRQNLTGVSQVVVEYLDTGIVIAENTFGLELHTQYKNGDGRFFHYDGSHNVRVITDLAGNISDTFVYTAFGTLASRTGTTETNYMFSGDRFNDEESLLDLRARSYDPATGRFLSRDPFEGLVGQPSTLHRYMYANSNPIAFVDPTGEFVDFTLIGQSLVRVFQAGIYTATAVTGTKALYQFATTGTIDKQDLIDTFAKTTFYVTLAVHLPAVFTAGGGLVFLANNKAVSIFNTLSLISKRRDVYMQDFYSSILLSDFVDPTIGGAESAVKGALTPGLNTNSINGVLATIIIDFVGLIAAEITGVDPKEAARQLILLDPEEHKELYKPNEILIPKGRIDEFKFDALAELRRYFNPFVPSGA